MTKKIVFVHLILLFLMVEGICFADTPSEAFLAKKEQMVSYFEQNMLFDAGTVYYELITEFGENPEVAAVSCLAGDYYFAARKLAKSKEAYQHSLGVHPDHELAMWAKAGLAMSNIMRGDYEGAQVATDKLTSDYPSHQLLLSDRVSPVTDQYPMWIQADVAMSNIKLENYAAAQVAVNKLISDHQGNQWLPEWLACPIEQYRFAGKYQEVLPLYQYISDNHREHEFAIWAQTDVAILNIKLGDYAAAEVAVDKLFSDYTDHVLLPYRAYAVADEYRTGAKYQKSLSLYQYMLNKSLPLYQYVLTNWPEHEQSLQAQAGLAMSNIELENYSAAEVAIDKLILDHQGHELLPQWLFAVSEYYYYHSQKLELAGNHVKSQEIYQKATVLLDKIIQESVQTKWQLLSYQVAGDCYSRLGQFAKAQQYYQQIMTNYSDYEYAWHIQFLLGRNYEKMLKAGQISNSEAIPLITNAYEKLLEDYPDCKAAPIANRWLAGH